VPDAGRAVRVAILLIATMARGTVLHAMGADDQTVRPDLRLQAVRSGTPIVTDGTLDKEAWKKAPDHHQRSETRFRRSAGRRVFTTSGATRGLATWSIERQLPS